MNSYGVTMQMTCYLPAGFLSGTRQCSDYWVGEWKPSDGPLGSNSVKYYYFVFNVAIFLSSQNVCGGVGGGKKGGGGVERILCDNTKNGWVRDYTDARNNLSFSDQSWELED